MKSIISKACSFLFPSVLALVAVGCAGADAGDESVAETSQALNSIEECNRSGKNVIIGTPNDDNIIGTNVADCIAGLGGQDRIDGRLGDDIIYGDDGNDTLIGGGGVDGIFGGQTQAAVIAFQKWKGLVRDGIPGPRTRAALSRARRPKPLTEGPGTRVEILLDRQVLLFIRNGWVARTIHVSTGKRGFVTPSGQYSVLRKRRRARSIPYKVWLPWASFIVGGIAIHESANVPVRRASHGCIRVPRYDAMWLFRRTPVGTPVTVLARSR